MSKKAYCQYFRPAYKAEFPTIKESNKGNNYVYCNLCVCDFLISHGGRSDIIKHLKSKKHESNLESSENNLKVSNFFQKSVVSEQRCEVDVIRAECMFTSFLVEHNLPISAADHATSLFKKMFPDSDIAKKYACSRTKTSAIVKEMASIHQKDIISVLQRSAFSLAIDGSNDTDSKLYPIVVTYFDEHTNEITSSLLRIPVLHGDSTGKNIASLITGELKNLNIPFENCVSFCSDNAAVMIGSKNGVAAFLKEQHIELIILGCCCHLINLAAEKAALVLPVHIDQIIVDIYYYLEKSAKHKETLKQFQQLHGEDTHKILKHVCTRWLSLGRSLARIIEMWTPLLSYFHDCIKSKPQPLCLSSYKIPKISVNKKSSTEGKKCPGNGKELLGEHKPKKIRLDDGQPLSLSKKEQGSISREEKIFLFLSSDLNKVYCSFLLNTISTFEEINTVLQSASPQIPYLRCMLNNLLKDLFVKFLKPKVIKNCSKLTHVQYHDLNNQKGDADLIIGNHTSELLNVLKDDEKKEFFSAVRKYFMAACDYIVRKFPLESEVLKNAEVANLPDIENASFNSIRYFVNKFPFLLKVKDGESSDTAKDELQKQFLALQLEHFNKSENFSVLIGVLRNIKKADGVPKYDRIIKVLTAILTLPHSNAECERVFSVMKKNKTLFRSNMNAQTLEQILIIKCKEKKNCYDSDFSLSFLNQTKKATINLLK